MSEYTVEHPNGYSFVWGPMTVERVASHRKYGAWLEIKGAKNTVCIRVTPAGFVRVGPITKKPIVSMP